MIIIMRIGRNRRLRLLLGLVGAATVSLIVMSLMVNESFLPIISVNVSNSYRRQLENREQGNRELFSVSINPKMMTGHGTWRDGTIHGSTMVHPAMLRKHEEKQEAIMLENQEAKKILEDSLLEDSLLEESLLHDDDDPSAESSQVHLGNGGTRQVEITSYNAPVNEPHGVKCCTHEEDVASSSPRWVKKPSDSFQYLRDWCPHSYDFDDTLEGDCALRTFADAQQFCASKGGRLCTAQELQKRCAVSNGCQLDLQYVWTTGLSLVHIGNGGGGNTNNGHNEDDLALGNFEAPVNEPYAVKCCSRNPPQEDTGGANPHWTKSPAAEEWCPFSYNYHRQEECKFMTFREANEFCTSKGGRLCSADELTAKCATHNGCDFDTEFVWTGVYSMVHRGNGGNGQNLGENYDAPVNQPHGVKCCTDNLNPGLEWSKNQFSKSGCPLSYNFGPLECQLRTLPEANEFCATKGGRLCTPQELANHCAAGNGCGFDLELVWTQPIRPNIIDAPATKASGRTLVHVFSPYHDPSATIFDPLDFEQWTALVSASTARDAYVKQHKNYFLFDSVVLVCAIVQEEAQVLTSVLSSYCDRIVVLPRSTADVYPHLKKALPFIQDVIDAGKSVMDGDDKFHLMLTNSDICPTEGFYLFVEQRLRKPHMRERPLIINRMTIPMDQLALPISTNGPFQVKHQLATDLMDQAREAVQEMRWMEHPGFDCFVVQSTVLQRFNFGEMFLGYPQWSSNFVMALKSMTDHRHIIIKSQKQGTYHIGDMRKWNDLNTKIPLSTWKLFSRDELEVMMHCPILIQLPRDVYTLQNYINCGKLFQPIDENVNVVPPLVEPGFENIYIRNWEGQRGLAEIQKKYFKRKYVWLRDVRLCRQGYRSNCARISFMKL
mmetsp:Transcript_15516/g.32800  ORF Transcript_15516/g.32800 Transcript_15516/m.32800 type:complete len:888 (-) Transcript_15516:41-2704(-)